MPGVCFRCPIFGVFTQDSQGFSGYPGRMASGWGRFWRRRCRMRTAKTAKTSKKRILRSWRSSRSWWFDHSPKIPETGRPGSGMRGEDGRSYLKKAAAGRRLPPALPAGPRNSLSESDYWARLFSPDSCFLVPPGMTWFRVESLGIFRPGGGRRLPAISQDPCLAAFPEACGGCRVAFGEGARSFSGWKRACRQNPGEP
jgi:hypothetical protein